MSVSTPTRRALPAAVALVALVALLASAGPAPAAPDGGYPPPNYPRAVPEAPGAMTGTHARTPSNISAALATERSYSSYGDPPPAAAPKDIGPAGGRDGIGVAPLVLALAGALVLGLAVGGLAPLARARRRHRVEIAS